MYGSSTTKELKKKHSSRLAGKEEPGSQAERTHGKAAAGKPNKAVACSLGSPIFAHR